MAAEDGLRDLTIDGVIYRIDDRTAAICHSLALLLSGFSGISKTVEEKEEKL